MKRNYMVMGLVLLVGLLTGFIVNTQAPTRWEYGHLRLFIRPGTSFTAYVILEAPPLSHEAIAEDTTSMFGAFELASKAMQIHLGCPATQSNEVEGGSAFASNLLSCVGDSGWELVSAQPTFPMGVLWFKRPAP